MRVIDKFENENRFLSNFYPCKSWVIYRGVGCPTVENAYQASKTNDYAVYIKFIHITPGQAKRLGRTIELSYRFNERKVEIMLYLVWRKFYDNKDLRDMLLKTGDAILIEGNTWGDTFWGMCNGKGENWLGRILMTVRKTFKRDPLAYRRPDVGQIVR